MSMHLYEAGYPVNRTEQQVLFPAHVSEYTPLKITASILFLYSRSDYRSRHNPVMGGSVLFIMIEIAILTILLALAFTFTNGFQILESRM